MSNMSYCRFENTARAMADCLEATRDIEEGAGFADLNEYEQRGYLSLLRLSVEFIEAHNGTVTGVSGPTGDHI